MTSASLISLLQEGFVQNALIAGSLTVAGLIGAMGVRGRERDSVIGVILAFGLGLGVLFLTLYNQYATGAFALLFGTITGVSDSQLALLGGCGVAVLAAVAIVYRLLLFASVDPDAAEARGVSIRLMSIVFLVIMADRKSTRL